MTPSSGPPIRTSFLMRRKFSLHSAGVGRKARIENCICTRGVAMVRDWSLTLHLSVRPVPVQHAQEAVAPQVVGPVVGVWGDTSHQEGAVNHTGDLFKPGCYLSSSHRWKSSVPSCCSRCETRFSSCVEITTSGSSCLSGKITGSYSVLFYSILRVATEENT